MSLKILLWGMVIQLFFEYDELTGAVNQIPVEGFVFEKGRNPENLLSLYYGPTYSRATNSLVYSSGDAHSQNYYLYQDIQGMSLQLINYAKNEIYARRNRMFNSPELQGYFKGTSWYQPLITADAFSESIFNSIEFSNAQFLAECEHNMGMYKLDQSGYSYQPVYDYIKSKGRSGTAATGSSSASDNSAGQSFSGAYVDVSELVGLGAEDAARKAGFVLVGNYSVTAYETQNGRM